MLEEQALRGPARELASVGPWNIYEVADSDLVVPLAVQPVVVGHRSGDHGSARPSTQVLH